MRVPGTRYKRARLARALLYLAAKAGNLNPHQGPARRRSRRRGTKKLNPVPATNLLAMLYALRRDAADVLIQVPKMRFAGPHKIIRRT
ncbi:hypothetical protein MPLDJ20_140005 [Mesorhizobium plurifarium]|uniref:Uncharacterized protein n=1 Tax=Mesorhizobium plurifarium TaxID=69974 RepID=A0A090EPH6_MESPL|nr:hypothetical protein MPLDJ20_140005 [Mesorhizobium plurifarium]